MAVDTGGTFTDLVIEGVDRGLRFYKRPTTPDDPVQGLLNALGAAAHDLGHSVGDLLGRTDLFVFGTTRATNAVVTGSAAKTALLTTKGHPDTLLLREGGGRVTLFDYGQEYPDPYVSRSLTFEITERILSNGQVRVPLDEADVHRVAERLRQEGVEAVGVCFLWSIVNPEHELRVGRVLADLLPDIPHTLSHQLNPTLREYRRASSTVIDASLKPLMSTFFVELEQQLAEAGFGGRLLIVTSSGGMLDAKDVAESPIHSIGSGPAAAPVAGRRFAELEVDSSTALVTDAGGTTYDVSLVRDGRIPRTREAVIGHPIYGYLTGFPAVDVKSVGAGGGSIAWVDEGGLLHVGPQSAGAEPGPVCYDRGGDRATVTDACVVLGYIDPDFFLGGEIQLDVGLAETALDQQIGQPLGLPLHEAAYAVLNLAIERMVSAIEGITLNQGIDPGGAVMIGGGGGGGLYSVGIARRLGCSQVIVPTISAALSATGALLSELRADFTATGVTATEAFDLDLASARLANLAGRASAFIDGPGKTAVRSSVDYAVEARYPHQVWEIEVPLRTATVASAEDIQQLERDFHDAHEQLFAIRDPDAHVEIVSWRATAHCGFSDVDLAHAGSSESAVPPKETRNAYFPEVGTIPTPVRTLESLQVGEVVRGPLLVEAPTTTVVIDPACAAQRTSSGSLLLTP